MSYKEMLKIVLVAIGLIFLISESIGQTNAQKVGSADRQQVSICGTIRQEVKWGPPNFGENPKEDTKFTVWVISFKEPTLIAYGDDIGEKLQSSISDIQLSSESIGNLNLMKYEHKIVIATGKLLTGTSQGDVTPVILVLNKIRYAENGTCGGGNVVVH